MRNIILVILIIGLSISGFYGYKYISTNKTIDNTESIDEVNTIYSSNNDNTDPVTEQISEPYNRVFVSFIEKESGRKCSDGGSNPNLSSSYEIEFNENNQKRFIAGPLDVAYNVNNQIYYTYEDSFNKTFLVYKVDNNLKPIKLKEYKYDGINNISQLLVNESLVFILNKDQLYKLNLNNLNDKNIKLPQPFDLSNQVKDKEFVLQESRKRNSCSEVFGIIPQIYEVRELDNLNITKTLKNVPTSAEDQKYLETYKYVDNKIKMDQILILENGLFK